MTLVEILRSTWKQCHRFFPFALVCPCLNYKTLCYACRRCIGHRCCSFMGHWCSACRFAIISWLLWSRLAVMSRRRSSLRCLQKEIFELRSSPSNRVDGFFSSGRFILIGTEDWIMCLTSPDPQFKFHASIDLLLVLKSQLLNNFHFWSLFFLNLVFDPTTSKWCMFPLNSASKLLVAPPSTCVQNRQTVLLRKLTRCTNYYPHVHMFSVSSCT